MLLGPLAGQIDSCHLGRRQGHDAGRASDAARVAQATHVTHPVLLWPFRPFSSRYWCYSGHWWAMMLLGSLGPLDGPLGPLMPPMLAARAVRANQPTHATDVATIGL